MYVIAQSMASAHLNSASDLSYRCKILTCDLGMTSPSLQVAPQVCSTRGRPRV